ncbi:MAG: hypothetical protein KDG50_13365 [Chromatiales bacterium]|nr:hypothetical protein [Chromatiales bacterium]
MTLEPADLARFHASLERATADPRFLDLFYDGFLSSSEDIRRIFAHSDMDRLKRKLKSSLGMMQLLIEGAPGVDMYFGYLGTLHRGFRIPFGLYARWVDALIDALDRCDPDFSPELEQLWRRILDSALEAFRTAYDAESSGTPGHEA